MNIISVDSISKSLGDRRLFSSLSFGIDSGEKTALIGINGSGKSTLLRVLARELKPDSGEVIYNGAARIAYQPQVPRFDPAESVADHIFGLTNPQLRVVREYEQAAESLSGNHSEETRLRLEAATEQMESSGAWEIEARIRSILQELGIDDLSVPMGTLSGGMVKKVALAQALAGENDLLILDEPTNHLDIETILWLQSYLEKNSAALLLVTHDRYFLDTVTTRIYELDDEGLYRYDGNYSYYVVKREERLAAQSRKSEKTASILRSELEWLQRGPKARTGKDKKRSARIIDLMDRNVAEEQSLREFSVSHRRLGKKVLELKNLTRGYDGTPVIAPFSYSFKRGERIGLIGPNGSGKTTLLKLMTGSLDPDEGRVDPGINTRFGYFDQLSEDLDETQTVVGYLKEYAEVVRKADGKPKEITRLLEEFNFPQGKWYTRIRRLSGGERRRLQLLKVLLPDPNFLIFDEPTNDLDIQTLSLLEQFLSRFPGCLLVVSHDRYFLDRTVDFLLILEPPGKTGGRIGGFGGSYSEYLEFRRESSREERAASESRRPVSSLPRGPRSTARAERKGLRFKEQQEFDGLLPRIDELEEEKRALETAFTNPATPPDKLATLTSRYAAVNEEIERMSLRWEELAESGGTL